MAQGLELNLREFSSRVCGEESPEALSSPLPVASKTASHLISKCRGLHLHQNLYSSLKLACRESILATELRAP